VTLDATRQPLSLSKEECGIGESADAPAGTPRANSGSLDIAVASSAIVLEQAAAASDLEGPFGGSQQDDDDGLVRLDDPRPSRPRGLGVLDCESEPAWRMYLSI